MASLAYPKIVTRLGPFCRFLIDRQLLRVDFKKKLVVIPNHTKSRKSCPWKGRQKKEIVRERLSI